MAPFICPICQTTVPAPDNTDATQPQCPQCGHRWPIDQVETHPLSKSPVPVPPPLPTKNEPSLPPPPPPPLPKGETKPHRGTRPVQIVGRNVFRCLACGTEFSRPFKLRTRLSQHDDSGERLRRIIQAEQPEPRNPRKNPCPECGVITPKEASGKRQLFDVWLGLVGAIVLAFLLIGSLQFDLAKNYFILAVGIFAISIAQLVGTLLAEKLFPTKIAEPAKHPDPTAANVSYPVTSRRPAYVLLASALVLFAVHPCYRLIAPFPYSKPGVRNVAVVGKPYRVLLPNSLQSYGGGWSGTARVYILNASDFQPPLNVTAATHKEPHKTAIDTPEHLIGTSPGTYVDILFSDDPQLANKPVEIAIELSVAYPKPIDQNTFKYDTGNLEAEGTFVVVPLQQQITDRMVGLTAGLLGWFATVIAVSWLLRSNMQLARISFPQRLVVDTVQERDP